MTQAQEAYQTAQQLQTTQVSFTRRVYTGISERL